MRPVTQNPANTTAAITELVTASRENDILDVASNFTFTGTPTTTTNLNLTAPTLANAVAVLATLIEIMKKGGINRTN